MVINEGSEKLCCLLARNVASVGIVGELLIADASHSEVTCFGMGKHESRHTARRIHGSILGEGDAYVRKGEKPVDEVVYRLVGKAGVAHGRTYAMESLFV